MAKIKQLFWITLVTTPILLGVMVWHGEALKTSETPLGIIDAEFAATIERAHVIFDAWDPELLMHATINTYIDFLFLISYGLFLFAAAYLLSSQLKGFIQKIGKPIAFAFLFAAFLDVVENIGILVMLNGSFNSSLIAATTIFAIVKFLLVFIGLLYLFTGVLQYLFIRTRLRSAGIN